jgi:Domain of unknown function (DUF4349)
MRFPLSLLLLLITALTLASCQGANRSFTAAPETSTKSVTSAPALSEAQNPNQQSSLSQAESANQSSQAVERKIIRNANLTVEVTSPIDSQRKVSSIAESHQGFVVTSESTQRATQDAARPETVVTLVVRVPAAQFSQAMEEIRKVGARVVQEKITGQDVTEEFMDLEAQIKNQKALESQFLEIMKRADKVESALSVQRELAEVRTRIEKLEGRRRFLDNQASLSTITVALQPPTQIVNAAGFWYGIKSAFSDGVDAALSVVLFLIRAVIALLPIVLLIFLPLGLLIRFIIRRLRRRQVTEVSKDVPKVAI